MYVCFLYFVTVTPWFDMAGPQQTWFRNTGNAAGIPVCFQNRSSEFILVYAGLDQTFFCITFDPFIGFKIDFF